MKSSGIPWDAVLPRLIAAREGGAGMQALADSLSAEYNTVVTAQAVRYHLDHYLPTEPPSDARSAQGVLLDHVTAVRTAAERIGRLKSPMSGPEYDRFRQALPDDERAQFPSLETLRRHHGRWGNLMMQAGLPTRTQDRVYVGLTRTDAVLHVAHWLRAVRTDGTVKTPTAAEYRVWSKQHTDAPSPESLRRFGRWTDLLREAQDVEASSHARGTDLPTPSPVGKKGRRKSPLTVVEF